MRLALVLSATLVAAAFALSAAAQEVKAPLHNCDALAGNPVDPGRVGIGVATASMRPVPAIAACLDALKQFPNEPRFMFQLGRAYRQASQLNEALRWYRAAADKGYAGAINSLGVMHSLGEGVPSDCTKAAQLFSQAAALGYPLASDNLRTLACIRQV
ncbi:MAG: sel1 repeat family protein [Alphaproteobacteria bacterium]|nr:sel1 repeat family protein [Alphaproteobacteria bacterium]